MGGALGWQSARARSLAGWLFAPLALGCGDLQNTDAPPTGRLWAPPRGGFEIVADAMQLHCGTLDCHGQSGRNMRLYGQYGLRLDPRDNPLEQPTSSAEYDASYGAMVGLEPETLSGVVQHRLAPGALSMVRKARGIEKHKGGQLVLEGDSLDRCIVGWLIGAPDTPACSSVIQTPRPRYDGGP